MITPLISVILPLYNEPEFLAKQAVDSILMQTYSNIEVLLLLDNPENLILKNLILKYKDSDKRVRIHLNDKNLGLPETLNKGIDLATGTYIARMDGDDISTLDRFSKQLNFLISNPDIDLVGSDTYVIDEDGELIGEYHKLRSDFSQKMMLRYVAINLVHPTWLGKSDIFRKCRYRNFAHCEDYDFMLRAYAMKYKFHNIQEKLLFCRIQQKSLRSVSRKYAYEQYINTIRARNQFVEFLKKGGAYPILNQLTYNQNDKERYQATIPHLNQLREAYFQKKILDFFILFLKIYVKDARPLITRLKVVLLSKSLWLLEITETFMRKNISPNA